MAGAFPDAAQFVLSAEQLAASNITPDLAAGLRSVLVYGADLHAFDVLATLIAAGVDAGQYLEGPLALPSFTCLRSHLKALLLPNEPTTGL